jgi:hypothetical protein
MTGGGGPLRDRYETQLDRHTIDKMEREEGHSVATTFYEVWDDETGNRVGGAFDTLEEATTLLADVLRVNGPSAAGAMAILAFHPTADGRFAPVTVLEGAAFVDEAAASAPPAGQTSTV